jgi:glycosyltransferase involved in cell wall biosynthesis
MMPLKIHQNSRISSPTLPLVSVIIPFFNRIELLNKALESTLNQTYRNIEIILINDGSTESLDDLIRDDPRIIFFEQKNAGPSVARNLGIAKSRGDYIAFLDSDDLFFSDKIETQVVSMERHRVALLSHTSFIYVDEFGNEIKKINSGKFQGRLYPKIFLHCPIATSTVMMRREIKDLGLKFCENIKIAEDTIFWAQIAKISPILGIDTPLSKICIHENTTAKNPELRLNGGYNIYTYGIKQDRNLPEHFGNIGISLTHLSVAKLYFKNFDLKNFIKNFFLSSKYLQIALINKNN